MSSRIEVEAKYFLKEKNNFLEIIKEKGFEKVEEVYEEDIYFTDLASEYIKNRTCLRIRKNEKGTAELTFKGKSNVNQEFYAKRENNILVNSKDIEELIGILNSLGYYKYVAVKKERVVYKKEEADLIYNIMIDNISNVGDFVEFEILCDDETRSIESLKEKLNTFVSLFDEKNLEVASLPYRDFVALEYYKRILNNKTKTNLLLDFDGTIVNSEKEFFKAFKDTILEKYNYEITIEEYKKNELDKNANLIETLKDKKIIDKNITEKEIMQNVYSKYDKYFNNVLEDKDTIINIELMKQLTEKGYNISIVSTSRRKYINEAIKKFKLENVVKYIVAREDVEKLKPNEEAYLKAVSELKLKKEDCLAVEDSNRGIKSAINAGLDVVQVSGFSMLQENYECIFNINSFSELALILLNN